MTNPTLKDFIDDSNNAMRNGYYPDFMSCGALVADCFCWGAFTYNYELIINLLRDDVISLPKNLILLLIHVFCFFTLPLFFPVWWIVLWIFKKKQLKQIAKQEERLNRLL